MEDSIGEYSLGELDTCTPGAGRWYIKRYLNVPKKQAIALSLFDHYPTHFLASS